MINAKGVGITATAFLVLAMLTALNADEQTRKWTDKTGQFEVEAKLLKQADGKVRLLKKDGRLVEVAITALSEADQKYLKEVAEAENPFAGGEMMESDADAGSSDSARAGSELFTADYNAQVLPSGGMSLSLDFDEPAPPLPADPSGIELNFQEFARPLEKLDAYARASNPILIDPKTPLFAVSTHRNGNAVSPAHFGRIYLVSANERQPKPVLDIDQTFLLLDHHVESGRSVGVIGVNSPSDRGGDLVLLENLASGQPRAVTRWHLPEWDRPGFKPKVEFARLLDANRAIVKVNDAVYLWGLESGEIVFKIDRVRAGSKIEVSGGGSYMAVPTTKACSLVDLKKGEYVGNVPFPTSLTPEVRFSPGGEQLALVAGNQVVVWSLPNASVTAEATVGNPSGKFLGWVGEKYLLTQLAGLIDPKLGMSVWYYSIPTGNQAITMPGGMAAVDKLQTSALLCLPVPHGPVENALQRLSGNNDSLMAVRPGSEVSLHIDAVSGVDKGEMLEGLRAAVEAVGWKVSSRASIRIEAKVDQGKKQKLTFRPIGSSMFRTDNIQTVSIKPYTASLVIRRGDEVLWSRSMTNMVPSFLTLGQGETLQKAVKKFEKADPGYFKRLTIPPRILRPDISKSVGRSRVVRGNWAE